MNPPPSLMGPGILRTPPSMAAKTGGGDQGKSLLGSYPGPSGNRAGDMAGQGRQQGQFIGQQPQRMMVDNDGSGGVGKMMSRDVDARQQRGMPGLMDTSSNNPFSQQQQDNSSRKPPPSLLHDPAVKAYGQASQAGGGGGPVGSTPFSQRLSGGRGGPAPPPGSGGVPNLMGASPRASRSCWACPAPGTACRAYQSPSYQETVAGKYTSRP